jgi:hypothetical protein
MLLVNDETAVPSNGHNISVVYLSVLYVIRRFCCYRFDQVRVNGLVSYSRNVGHTAPTPTAHASKASDELEFRLENPHFVLRSLYPQGINSLRTMNRILGGAAEKKKNTILASAGYRGPIPQ